MWITLHLPQESACQRLFLYRHRLRHEASCARAAFVGRVQFLTTIRDVGSLGLDRWTLADLNEASGKSVFVEKLRRLSMLVIAFLFEFPS